MVFLEDTTYLFASRLFLKALGAIYLIAFASFGRQVLGLIGGDGILPAGEYLSAVRERRGSDRYRVVPTVFWLDSSDRALQFVCLFGIVFAVCLIVGVFETVAAIGLLVGYLSLVAVGQVFMAYQWDALLVEAGLLGILLTVDQSAVVVWLFHLLLFKLMFLSGATKLISGDESWRALRALVYHHETQPLPTPPAYFVHHLPKPIHRLSTLGVLFIELVLPFFIFVPGTPRLLAATAFVLLQTLIFVTGNYNFFNLLAVALTVFLVGDGVLAQVVPGPLQEWLGVSAASQSQLSGGIGLSVLVGVAVVLTVLNLLRIGTRLYDGMPAPVLRVLGWLAPLRIINSYGLFAVMTTVRPEIIVEGSNTGTEWRAYEFRYKPGDVTRRPPVVAPHQPRLDWQMWFAALGSYVENRWFLKFVQRLFDGSPQVLALLAENPFPDEPPTYLRAVLYTYTFTDSATKRQTGAWWQRERVGLYLPAVSRGSFTEQ